jgi:hypothetical protein
VTCDCTALAVLPSFEKSPNAANLTTTYQRLVTAVSQLVAIGRDSDDDISSREAMVKKVREATSNIVAGIRSLLDLVPLDFRASTVEGLSDSARRRRSRSLPLYSAADASEEEHGTNQASAIPPTATTKPLPSPTSTGTPLSPRAESQPTRPTAAMTVSNRETT